MCDERLACGPRKIQADLFNAPQLIDLSHLKFAVDLIEI